MHLRLRFKNKIWLTLVVTLIAVVVYLANASWLVDGNPGQRNLVAHRSLHQFHNVDDNQQLCTAEHLLPPTHDYVDNTLAAFRASFSKGADIVELDIHPTTDGEFVVFRDWELSCRTNGKGFVRRHPLAYLKRLDIGYGYTADGGQSFPYRGLYVGAMLTLGELLRALPNNQFMINMRGESAVEAEQLTDYLSFIEVFNSKRVYVRARGAAARVFKNLNPDIVMLDEVAAADCIAHYRVTGWLGWVSSNCENAILPVSLGRAKWLWGWPNRFEQRMRARGSQVMLVGAVDGYDRLGGIDDFGQFKRVPKSFGGLIYTHRIDLIGPLQSF